ncbi:essential mcu regulator mitochondrial [Holotrichia oblita]|uniref:Essential mcu regulator mitochondrial n=1 Tax=Holotrichia oblita TaxID=644536 RepID=A0ACB9T5T7_HOLOL|nr:essential mcu regulator mitochondrial [Holotrichia oblita]
MIISRFNHLLRVQPWKYTQTIQNTRRKSDAGGSILPEPPITKFGLLGIVATVATGLLIGAAISKSIANFLEENDLFVPSDDDDDDD